MKWLLMILFGAGVVLVSLSVGVESLSLKEAFLHPDSLAGTLLWEVRLPRVLVGALVGMSLSVAGLAFQALLRNPLADPFILGVSGGAALGSVVAVGLHLSFVAVSLVAFISAFASMILIYWLAQVKGRLNPHTLLLVGVLFNATTFALILFLNSLVSMEDLHRIWFLMVGSLEAMEYSRIAVLASFVLAGTAVLFWDASALNLITLGEESAALLGVDVEKVRKRVFFAASLMIGATVSISGLIGFVGLAVPHMMRLTVGTDHRKVLPAAILGGASFLVLSDWVARIAFSSQQFQTQLPVGVITALVGAPFFFYLLKRRGT
jgi:iron complex transport system permease protein